MKQREAALSKATARIGELEQKLQSQQEAAMERIGELEHKRMQASSYIEDVKTQLESQALAHRNAQAVAANGCFQAASCSVVAFRARHYDVFGKD